MRGIATAPHIVAYGLRAFVACNDSNAIKAHGLGKNY
jgi:hypothetical protein